MPVVGELLTGDDGSGTRQGARREGQRRRGVAPHEVIGARRRGETDDGIDCGVEGAVSVRTASRRSWHRERVVALDEPAYYERHLASWAGSDSCGTALGLSSVRWSRRPVSLLPRVSSAEAPGVQSDTGGSRSERSRSVSCGP